MIVNNVKFFFPPNCSAQSWIANFVTAQIQSKANASLRHLLLGYDFHPNSIIDGSFSSSEFFGNPTPKKELHDRRNDMIEKIICLNTSEISGKNAFLVDKDYIRNSATAKNSKTNSKINLLLLNQTLPAHWAHFIPKIVFKYQERKNGKFETYDFPFKRYTDVSKILDDEFSKGDGCGISSLKVDRKVTVPDNNGYVPTTITADFKFQSLAVFNQKIDPGFASFSKLISNLSSTQGKRLILEYGWALPESYEHHDPILENLARYIDAFETKRMRIAYSGHTLSFEENGEITLSATYNAINDISSYKAKSFIEGVDKHILEILNARSDIVFLHQEMTEKMKEVDKIEVELENLSLSDSKDSEDAKKKKKKLQDQKTILIGRINLLKKILLPFGKDLLLQTMIKNFSMFHVNFESKKSGSTIETTAFFNIISPKKGSTSGIIPIAEWKNNSDLSKSKIPSLTKAPDATALNNELEKFYGFETSSMKRFGDIIFFPLKSLVQAAYQLLPEEEKKEFSETLFCNATYSLSSKRGLAFANIGDIFIELQEFQRWYFNKFIKNDVLEFSFGDLIRACCELASIGLNSSFGKKKTGITGLIHLSSNWISKKASINDKKKIYYSGNIGDLESFVKNNIGYSPSDPRPLNILSMNPSSFSSRMASMGLPSSFAGITSFDESRDAANGIYTLQIGASTGILKKINFSAEDFQLWRSAAWIQSMKDWNIQQPRYRYSFDGTFIGTSIFWNGTLVAIPEKQFGLPKKSGGPFLQDLGIAGYYLVFGCSDSIQNGIYETSIKGMWHWNPLVSKKIESKESKDVDDPATISSFIEEGDDDDVFAELFDLNTKKEPRQEGVQQQIVSLESAGLTDSKSHDTILVVDHESSKEQRGRLSLS